MDALLAVIGFLGLGALLIASWVLVSVTTRYLSGRHAEEQARALASDLSPYRDWSDRAGRDRRRNEGPVVFPITIDGKLIPRDRRRGERRRHSATSRDTLSAASELSSRR